MLLSWIKKIFCKKWLIWNTLQKVFHWYQSHSWLKSWWLVRVLQYLNTFWRIFYVSHSGEAQPAVWTRSEQVKLYWRNQQDQADWTSNVSCCFFSYLEWRMWLSCPRARMEREYSTVRIADSEILFSHFVWEKRLLWRSQYYWYKVKSSRPQWPNTGVRAS